MKGRLPFAGLSLALLLMAAAAPARAAEPTVNPATEALSAQVEMLCGITRGRQTGVPLNRAACRAYRYNLTGGAGADVAVQAFWYEMGLDASAMATIQRLMGSTEDISATY